MTGHDYGDKKIKCEKGECRKIKGTVVLMKKNALDFNDLHAGILDGIHELVGKRISLQLVSAVNTDSSPTASNGGDGKTYLPSETPAPLHYYREQELLNVRGDGTGELQEWDRVYDCAYYDDLGDPDNDKARPVLGGSTEYPYPRRGRTGRPPAKTDPSSESRLPLLMSLNIYVPRDERFDHLKTSDILGYALKSISQFTDPALESVFDSTPKEFDSLAEEIFPTNEDNLFEFPTPQVIQEDRSAWRTDEEFAREMLAGMNAVIIRCLEEFPPRSKLNPELYGNQGSTITKQQREHKLSGLTLEKILINAGGVLESTVFPAKYAMELSSAIYKNWTFPEEALPEDLKNRVMAVEDPNSPHGLRLLIEDYPYAVDGLDIWFAIKNWELREEGHGDKKNEPRWPKMQNRQELIETCTIIIWIASALRAAVKFGQYLYAGFLPNRPTISRRFMPEKGTSDCDELESNPDKVFLKTITAQLQTLLGIALIEILSRHSTDEVYLGKRDTP
ncbi:hypothetical protein Pint_19858 [Pistacia integerrima]|uniref:Uncharacterized protein n=1 Tax=Pistacia integerrima TaxID=434235 RepID=A0ACC0XDL7_9ROSI|nr:hypothetical protein Pint_19858 [Pistacia integerrima]